MDPTLRIFVDRRRSRPVVAVVGALDVGSARSFDDHVGELCGSVAAVDARYVTFIDAAGIAALVRLGADRPLPVVTSPPVARLIGICGLEPHLVLRTAEPPQAFDEAPFAVLEIGDDDAITYVNATVTAHVGLAAGVLVGRRWSDVLAFAGLRRCIGDVRSSGGPALASTVTRGRGPDIEMCWTVWTLDRASGSRAVVAIGAPG